MTHREKLERRRQRREEWAEKAAVRGEAAHRKASTLAEAIPLGQPILVSHHSEGRARRDRKEIRRGFDLAAEEASKAQEHLRRADGLKRALGASIFSDDVGADEALEARIAAREGKLAARKAINAAWRKTSGSVEARLAALVRDQVLDAAGAAEVARTFALRSGTTQPFPAFSLANLRQAIARDKARRTEVALQAERRAARAQAAQASGRGFAVEFLPDGFVRVTFAEKPAREVLTALRQAGFWWKGGSWTGRVAALPGCLGGVPPATSGPTPARTAVIDGEVMRLCSCAEPQPRFSAAELAGLLPGQGRAPPSQYCDGCFRPVVKREP